MNIKLPYTLLKEYLATDANPGVIADKLSLSGPTVEHLDQIGNDVVMDIEIITNRVDSASALGVAREASAILPQSGIKARLVNNPYDRTAQDLMIPAAAKNPVTVVIHKPSLVPRFTCIALDHVNIKPSPPLTQSWLTLSDERPLNNVIDITNELTLRFGQPVHIFDLDKIKGHHMLVRLSRAGEKITTLDGKTHSLKGEDIVIEDGDGRLIDLCGVMGGDLSAVDNHTTRVLLFVQSYDPQKIRQTSLYTQERTIAAQIFEKSPDPEMVLPVLIEGVKLLQARSGAVICSTILDIYPNPPKPKTINLDLAWLKRFVGISIPQSQIISILTNLGFIAGQPAGETIPIKIPSWRVQDVSIPEDLAEEITRVYGYSHLPSHLPPTTIPATPTAPILRHESLARHYLACLGFTEMYNNSLISEALAKQAGFSLDRTFRLTNPLAIDYEYMRPALIPSLLQNLSVNRGEILPPVLLFELANIYLPKNNHPLAHEQSTLAFVAGGQTFLKTKGYIEALFKHFKLNPEYTFIKKPPVPFDPVMTAAVKIASETVGYLGRIDPLVLNRFALSQPVFAIEINFELLSTRVSLIHRFIPVPAFPGIIEDLTFTLPPKTYLGPVIGTITQTNPLIESVRLKTVYNQNFTFTITYRHPKKSLTDQEAAKIRQQIVQTLQTKFHGKLVGKLT